MRKQKFPCFLDIGFAKQRGALFQRFQTMEPAGKGAGCFPKKTEIAQDACAQTLRSAQKASLIRSKDAQRRPNEQSG